MQSASFRQGGKSDCQDAPLAPLPVRTCGQKVISRSPDLTIESLELKVAIISKFFDHLKFLDAYTQTKDQEANIFVSKTALNDAVDEIVRDVEIMRYRRGSVNPQTRGKIAVESIPCLIVA